MDASQDIGLYEAELVGRRGVPVAWYVENMPDATAWTFNEEAHDLGLDPWREITGVDWANDGKSYYLDYSRGTSPPLPPSHRVFVQVKDIPETV